MRGRLSSLSPGLWSRCLALSSNSPQRVTFQLLPFGISRYSTTSSAPPNKTKYGGKLLVGSAILALGFYAGKNDFIFPIAPARGQRQRKSDQVSDDSDPWKFMGKYASPDEVQLAVAELRKALPANGQVDTDPDDLRTYGSSDNSYHPTSQHSVVVHVRSTEEVVHVVNISRKFKVPITAYSGATSLEGHFSGVSSLLSYYFFCI